jgi:hypothetical protein
VSAGPASAPFVRRRIGREPRGHASSRTPTGSRKRLHPAAFSRAFAFFSLRTDTRGFWANILQLFPERPDVITKWKEQMKVVRNYRMD